MYHSIIILKSPSAQFLDSRVRSHIVSLPLYSNNRCNSSLITVNIVTHFWGVFESLCLTNWYQFCVVINLSSLFDLILIKLQSSSYFFEWRRFLHMDAFCRCFFLLFFSFRSTVANVLWLNVGCTMTWCGIVWVRALGPGSLCCVLGQDFFYSHSASLHLHQST